MTTPVDIPLRMELGVPFTHEFTWDVDGEPVVLAAGSTAEFVMREGFRSPIVLSLDETDGITLADGSITMAFTPDMNVMRYRYALFVTPLDGERTKLVASHVDVYPDESASGGGSS